MQGTIADRPTRRWRRSSSSPSPTSRRGGRRVPGPRACGRRPLSLRTGTSSAGSRSCGWTLHRPTANGPSSPLAIARVRAASSDFFYGYISCLSYWLLGLHSLARAPPKARPLSRETWRNAMRCRSRRRWTRGTRTSAGSLRRSACLKRTTAFYIRARTSSSRAARCSSIRSRIDSRRINRKPITLEDGGLAVEALALIRHNGLVSRNDFHDIVDSDPIFPSIEQKLARYANATDKEAVLDEALRDRLGAKPPVTHLDGETLKPAQLARVVLGDTVDRIRSFARRR